MAYTLKDIADALGISVNTVSRAVRGKDGLSESLRQKIQAKAAEFGYVPNLRASSLRTGHTKAIAIVYDNPFNPYYAVMTGMLQRELYENKYNVMIFSHEGERGKVDADKVREILSRGVDGIISFLEFTGDAVSVLERTGKEYIVLGREQPGMDSKQILSDDERGGYIAGKYLVDLGHSSAAVFTIGLDVSCAAARLRGFRSAFVERGLNVPDENVFILGGDGDITQDLIEKAEQACGGNTAVFCFNDMLALTTMKVLRESGKRVPEDVSVIGYDYIESRLTLPVGLTTVDPHKDELAKLTAARMIAMLEGGGTPVTGIPGPELVQGATVAPVPAK